MRERGRPTKLDDALQERIVQALVLGNYRKDAAEFAGIDAVTLHRWMVKGIHEPDGPYGALRAAVIEAEARAKVTATGCVVKAMRAGDWKAAAFWLERKFPHQFSDRSQLFVVAKAFEQIEAAAEAAGTPIPAGVWETAWASLARDFARKVPAVPGIAGALEAGGDDDEELASIDLSEDERALLVKTVQAARRGRPQDALVPEADDG